MITAFAIVKSPNGQNLWQTYTYKIQGEVVFSIEKSEEDLREIHTAKIQDKISGFIE
jgi:hypothetical protein